jgi:hypothetical protein
VRLDRLEVHERDLQRPDRWLRASGQVGAAGEGVGQGSFEMQASKMLVMGPIDAPQAELDLALDGTVDLRRAVNRASVRISQLEVSAPERLLRFLWPVTVGKGDLIEQQGADGQPAFRLPEPPSGPTPSRRPSPAPPSPPARFGTRTRSRRPARRPAAPSAAGTWTSTSPRASASRRRA